MELKPNIYVRTLTFSGISRIGKLEKIDDICITDNGAVDKNQIIKASDNIIDLIEVGDYVNGSYVDEIISDNDSWDDRKHFHLLKFISYFSEEDIKSIVTKEMFESISYKVGD